MLACHRHHSVHAFEQRESHDPTETSSGDFSALAKQVTGLLASEFASNTDNINNQLESWLMGSHDEELEVPPRPEQTGESDAKRMMRLTGEMWGMPISMSGVMHSAKSWLSNPTGGEESHDNQMVARIVHRLLDTYKKQTGEEFDPSERQDERQWERLCGIASRVLGSSITRRMLKRLVTAYLGM